MAGPPRLMSLFLLLAATAPCVSPLAAPRGHARISRPAALLSTVVALATRRVASVLFFVVALVVARDGVTARARIVVGIVRASARV